VKKIGSGIARSIVNVMMLLLVFSSIVCIEQYSVVRGISLIATLFTLLYGGFFFSRPHGNMLKYAMLLLAVSMIFAAESACTLGDTHLVEATTLLLACCTVCYCAGRLHKYRQNIILFGFIGVNLIANYIFRIVNASDLHGPFQYIAAACYLIVFSALTLAYFGKYHEHAEAGTADVQSEENKADRRSRRITMKKRRTAAVIFAAVLMVTAAIVSLHGALGAGQNNGIAARIGAMVVKSYKAEGVESYLESNDTVTVSLADEVYFFDGPGHEQAMIFYPGAQVEYTAYAPLMYELAEGGMDCFLVKMPMDLAVLGTNRADDIMDSYAYESWNLGGHSLGGAVIAGYAAKTDHDIDGLYLLAAYLSKDVKDIEDVLVLYGDRDTILSMDKVESGRRYATSDYREYVIVGGNHSQFGAYEVPGDDGEAVISGEEQIHVTAAQILKTKGLD